jgi:hypothetical protein
MFCRPKLHLLWIILLITSLISCKKDKQFLDEPVISLTKFEQIKNYAGKDSVGVLHLYFTDGDGDMGLSPSDTFPPFDRTSPYYYNFYINYFEKQNGQWIRIVTPPIVPGGDTLSNHSRIPYLTPDGQNKTLEGDLSMTLFTNNPFSAYDTIKYEVTIVDRALNRSNQIKTADIILTK